MACEIETLLQGLCLLFIVNVHYCQQNPWPHVDANLFGRPGEGYYVGVQIGTPPQKFNVLLDTGSTNFAIAASTNPNIDKFYKSTNSSSYKSEHRKVSVFYTQGNWTGELGNDVLDFPSLKARPVSCDIALIQTSHNFFMNGSQWQGILGLAYSVIVRPDRTVVSWLDSLKSSYPAASSLAFSMELCGSKPFKNRHSGRLSVMDDVAATERLVTTPIVKEWFYEILLTGVAVGNRTVDLPCRDLNADKSIVDSGTTNLRFPEKVFKAVVELISKSAVEHKLLIPGEFWTQQKISCWYEELNWKSFPNISLNLMHEDAMYFTLELTSESYIRMAYDSLDTTQRQYCYKFGIESSDTGSVLGVVVMEGFHVVFNRTGRTVGFEKARCGPPVSIYGPFVTNQHFESCANPKEMPDLSALQMFAYTIAGLLCICGLVFVYCLTRWLWNLLFRRRMARNTSESSLMSED